MRNNLGNGSIIKNTNRLISSTSSNLRSCRVGSFLKFKSDSNHYIISKIDPLFYITEFEKVDGKKIKINSDTSININILDTVIISYKEWEIQTINSIISQGRGYKIGDVLCLDGGKPIIGVQDNLKNIAKIHVDNTDENGSILKISILEKGKYYEYPEESIVVGGKGEGAKFDIRYKICDNRTMIERDVQNVEFDGKNTIITLNYDIPNEIKLGKISVDKWEIFLSTPYVEETKINETYETTRDFSPHLNIPLMLKGSLSMETIFNSSILMMEKKIKELENRISKLES